MLHDECPHVNLAGCLRIARKENIKNKEIRDESQREIS